MSGWRSVRSFAVASMVIMAAVGGSGCRQATPPSTPLVPWYPAVNENGDPIAAVFEGRIPCFESGYVNCDKIKVALVLYEDQETKAPTTYKLARVYVAESLEGARQVVQGDWTKSVGTNLDPDAEVYELDSNAPPEFRKYWKIGDGILLMLDEGLMPKVGTAGWSFVLNRTNMTQ